MGLKLGKDRQNTKSSLTCSAMSVENVSPNTPALPAEEKPLQEEEDEKEYVIRNTQIQDCMSNREGWYSHSKTYWSTVPSTIDGMLGGYGSLTFSDLASSVQFLAPLYKEGGNTGLALDCGAGIGRVTKGLLLNIFDKVEMIDTCREHLDSAQEFLGGELFSRVSAQHCCGLEDFQPIEKVYDLVWIQWVIIYLSDYDFIALLARFKRSLKEGGYIVIKDNVCKSGSEMDEQDGSVTRSDYQLKQIFKKAGCEVVIDTHQRDFPKELFKVKYYALR